MRYKINQKRRCFQPNVSSFEMLAFICVHIVILLDISGRTDGCGYHGVEMLKM